MRRLLLLVALLMLARPVEAQVFVETIDLVPSAGSVDNDVIIDQVSEGILEVCSNGNTNNECIRGDLETTADVAAISSPTGVSLIDLVALDLLFDDNQWLGLGAAAGRVEFDDLATDEVNILNAIVGIGTAAPEATLHVHTSSDGDVAPSAGADDLIIQGTSPGLSILGPDAEVSTFSFGSPSDSLGVALQWAHDANLFDIGTHNADGQLRLLTAVGVEAVRIDASGNVGIGDTSPTQTLDVTGTFGFQDTMLLSDTAPTISSGFGTSPTVPNPNGTAAFTVNVGTGGTATAGVIALSPAASNGWHCSVHNLTGQTNNVADQRTVQSGTSTTTATVENQTVSTGLSAVWTASDILSLSCHAY